MCAESADGLRAKSGRRNPGMPGSAVCALPFPIGRSACRPAFLSPTVTATTSTSHQQRPPALASSSSSIALVVTSIARVRRRWPGRLARLCLASRAPHPASRPSLAREGERQAETPGLRRERGVRWSGVKCNGGRGVAPTYIRWWAVALERGPVPLEAIA